MCTKKVGQECDQLEKLLGNNIPIFFHDPIMPPFSYDPFWDDASISPYRNNQAALEAVDQTWRCFQQSFYTSSSLIHIYNFRTTGADIQNFSIENAVTHIYRATNAVFNINLGITTLLKRENESGDHDFRVFVAQNNRQNIFERNLFIHNVHSLHNAIDRINDLGSLAEYTERPSTEWRFVALLGVSFYVYIDQLL